MNDMTLRDYGHWIGGDSVAARSGATFESTDPTTGAIWARFADGEAADVDRAVQCGSHCLSVQGLERTYAHSPRPTHHEMG